MEFTKKTRTPAPDGIEEIRRRLLGWPDCYYRERDPGIRLQLLNEAEREQLTPGENGIRRELYERRYPSKGSVKDTYLRAWLDIRFMRDRNTSFFSRNNQQAQIKKILDGIGFDRLSDDKVYRGLLYQELYHLGMLYATLCQEDKGYGSLIFGIGHLSEEKLAQKIGAEFVDVAVSTLKKYGVDGKYTLWSDALTAAYCDMYPEYEHVFQSED